MGASTPAPAAARQRCTPSPGQILFHLPVARPAQLDHLHRIEGIALDEDDSRRLHRHVKCLSRSRSPRRPGQRGPRRSRRRRPSRLAPLALQLHTFWSFVLRQHLGEVLVDPQLLGDRTRDRFSIAREHSHLHPISCKACDSTRAFRPDHIGEGERATTWSSESR